jgi:hypothetical protein
MTARRTGPNRVAHTSARSDLGRKEAARSSSTRRRSGGSCCSIADSTIGPNAVCAAGFPDTGQRLLTYPASTGNVTPVT